jgi:hypothetical protein
MAGYIGTAAVPQATQKRQAFTATAGQTSFATSGYSVGFVDVYMNGVKLAAADYTATNGSDVVLATAALVNDIVEIVAFTSFVASDGLAAANNLSDLQNASTSRTNLGITLPNLGVTSTAAELNTLDAVPRGSIIYGNSSAATARLSKGATGTVLTAGADDISWVEASGGGEQTFTAGAAISAGDLVSIKTNGTIQTANGETSGIVTISGSTPEPENYQRMSSAFNGTDKIVIVYHEHANNIVAYVGTITNGTNLSWGSKVTVASGNKELPDVCYDSNAGKFLVVWRNTASSNRGEAAVGTVSGTSISFGSTVVYDSGGVRAVNVRYDDNAQKSMILYATASTGLKAVVATISGTSVSFGTALTIQNNGDNAGGWLNLLYADDANKFIAVFTMALKVRAIVLTISGTSITYGSNHDFETQLPYYMQAHYNKNENKAVIVWYRDSAPTGWVAVAGSISGTSFSTGTIWSGNINSPSQGYDETAQKSYSFVDGGVYREFAFSGNNVSVLATPTRDYAPGGVGSTVYSLGFDSYAGLKLNFFLWEYATLASTLLQSAEVLPWVGIAAENISSGATGKVTVAGGINTSVSGLTAGSTYGLPANSSAITAIPLGGDDESRIFGTALSSTSIYLDKGTLR